MWVPGIEPESSGRAAHVVNRWTISSAQAEGNFKRTFLYGFSHWWRGASIEVKAADIQIERLRIQFNTLLGMKMTPTGSYVWNLGPSWWNYLGKISLIGGGVSLGWILMFQKPMPAHGSDPVSFLSPLCFWNGVCKLTATTAMPRIPAAMLPIMTFLDSNHLQSWAPN